MSRLPRLLQPSLIVILLISVCTLAFVAYTQHQSQQRWHNLYRNELQQDYKQVGQLVTIQLARYGNVTDIPKTEFLDNQHQPVKPMLIEIRSQYDYVTFWFDGNHVPNTLLLHLPSWNEDYYRLITVPFFDWGGWLWLEPLVIPLGLCPEGTYLCDISSYGTCTCCQNQLGSQSGNEDKSK
jgi:hypothetical protein